MTLISSSSVLASISCCWQIFIFSSMNAFLRSHLPDALESFLDVIRKQDSVGLSTAERIEEFQFFRTENKVNTTKSLEETAQLFQKPMCLFTPLSAWRKNKDTYQQFLKSQSHLQLPFEKGPIVLGSDGTFLFQKTHSIVPKLRKILFGLKSRTF